jgi:alpha-glucosidase
VTGGTRNANHVCRKSLFGNGVLVGGVLVRDWTGAKKRGDHHPIPGGKCGGVGGGGGGGGRDGDGGGNNASWYNWALEREHYPKWQAFVDMLERRGISVGLYLCPYLEEVPLPLRSGRRYLYGEVDEDAYFVKRETTTRTTIMKRRKMMSRMKVKSSSKRETNGEETPSEGGGEAGTAAIYNIFRGTKCGLLDPTNPIAATWFKRAVREELMGYAGASFWLADMSMGGPPMDGVHAAPPGGAPTATANRGHAIITGIAEMSMDVPEGGGGGCGGGVGSVSLATSNAAAAGSGWLLHNSYAEEWAKVNHDAIAEAGRDGDGFFIVNCAYGSTTKYARSTSLGDHVVNFRRDGDGGGKNNEKGCGILRSVLNGLLNGGFSGLTHGHCAVNLAVPRHVSTADFLAGGGNRRSEIDSRSREMICRWFELTAFTTLFRTHDGDCGLNDRNGNLMSAYDDDVVMKSLARWSQVYVSLSEYRMQLMLEASARGFPVVRHPLLHFPNDSNFLGRTSSKKRGKNDDASTARSSAFMLGDLVYVVPILNSGVVRTEAYLPQGAWIHLWVRIVCATNTKGVLHFVFHDEVSHTTYPSFSRHLTQRVENN